MYSNYNQTGFELGSNSNRELEDEQTFINKVRKQKEKVELLAIQFQEQEQLLADKDNIINQLKNQNEMLREENNKFYEKQEYYIMTIYGKQEQIDQLNTKINHLVHQYNKLQKQRIQKRQQVKIEQIKSYQSKQSQSKIFNLFKQELNKINQQLKCISNKFKTKSQEVQQLHHCLELASKTISKLQAETLKHQKNNEFNRKQYETFIHKHQLQISQLKDELGKCQSKLVHQNNTVISHENSHQHSQFKINKLEEESIQKQKIIQKLEEKIVSYYKEMKLLEQDLIDRQNIIEKLNLKLQQQQRIDKIKKQLFYQRQKQSTQLHNLILALKIKHQ